MKYKGHNTIHKTLISYKNQKIRIEFAKKYRDEPQKL